MHRRGITAKQIRQEAAQLRFTQPHPLHKSNGDVDRHDGFVAAFSKGLPHYDSGVRKGEVREDAFATLRRALCSGDPRDFEAVQLGSGRKLTSPQAGLAFDLVGLDAAATTLPPCPRLDSEELAAEMVELYWMALLRDVAFTDYDANPVAQAAVAELGTFSVLDPKPDTAGRLFRGFTPGDQAGPYLSQFMLHNVAFGTQTISQRQRTKLPGTDHLTGEQEWLEVQDGKVVASNPADELDTRRRYIRNLRDLAHYVHFDALYQAYLNACLILLDMGAPVAAGNPYTMSRTQEGFATWGGPHILSQVTEVATRALKAVWHQKWYVHLRARPEAVGWLVHRAKKDPGGAGQRYAFLPSSLVNSDAVKRIEVTNPGHYLLPQAFPEGSPTHPAYGPGHATVAGACVTILKAWFDENHRAFVPAPAEGRGQRTVVVPSRDGCKLVPGPDVELRVGDELNKLAANISIGRNAGGVHYRSDYTQSVLLGEQIAISTLEDQLSTYNEAVTLTFTSFTGETVRIG